jgi:hypothetical protein
MAARSTQPLKEMSTRNLPGDKGRPACEAQNLTAICKPIVWKPYRPPRPVTGIALIFLGIGSKYNAVAVGDNINIKELPA